MTLLRFSLLSRRDLDLQPLEDQVDALERETSNILSELLYRYEQVTGHRWSELHEPCYSPRMHVYQVGEPYHPGKRRWPEAVQYACRGGEHELVLFWSQLDETTIQAVKEGRLELSVLERPPVILLLYRIEGACGWSDTPFSWHRLPRSEQVPLPPQDPGGAQALLHVILVEADTGLIRALRAVSFSSEQTRALHAAIWRQASYPREPRHYDETLADLFARHTSEQLARMGVM